MLELAKLLHSVFGEHWPKTFVIGSALLGAVMFGGVAALLVAAAKKATNQPAPLIPVASASPTATPVEHPPTQNARPPDKPLARKPSVAINDAPGGIANSGTIEHATVTNNYGASLGNLKSRATELGNEILRDLKMQGIRVTDPELANIQPLNEPPAPTDPGRKNWDLMIFNKYVQGFKQRVLAVQEDLRNNGIRDEMLDDNIQIMEKYGMQGDPSSILLSIAKRIKSLASQLP